MQSELPPFDPVLAGWRQHALSGFIELCGPLWSLREESGWKYGLLTNDCHANAAKIVHGGLLLTLLDHALSAIAWETTGRLPCVTIQIDTHFLSAVKPNSFVIASGRVTRQTKTLVFMHGALSVENEDVLTGNAILKIVRAI